MSVYLGQGAFVSHCYHQGFLVGCEDFRLWWSMWCMGAMSNEL